MQKICFYTHPIYLNNRIFEANESPINQNDVLACFRKLKEYLKAHGFELGTQDIISPEEASAVLYNEMPFSTPRYLDRQKSYLIALETEVVKPENWHPKRLKNFKAVFTAKEYSSSDLEVIKIQFPQKLRKPLKNTEWSKKKLCTMIAGGKISRHPLELYSERIEWINWFTQNHPDSFDFYGTNWNNLKMTGSYLTRLLNLVPYLNMHYKPNMMLYKGQAQDKYQTLNQYKFSICYENAHSINGYVTEKIFDCFFSNNIPIYLGAPDISNYIPENCYIDARNFQSKSHLYNYLSTMTMEQYNNITDNAKVFLQSDKFFSFSIEHFARTISQKIISDINLSS